MIYNTYFAICSGLAGVVFVMHVFAAGPRIAVPVRDCPELKPVIRLTNYYCWHIVSIVLAQLVFLFGWAAFSQAASLLALVGTSSVVAFGLWGFVLVVKTKQSFKFMPQALLFAPIAVLGIVGLLK